MNIVLTGSSTGIGRSVAERLLERGHRVWGIARSAQSDLRDKWPNFFFSKCDVAEWFSVSDAAGEIEGAWSHVHGVITCAGTQGTGGRTLVANPGDWASTVNCNLNGTFHILRALNPMLNRSEERAKIVCFTGGGAVKARPYFSAYGSSKAGVLRLVQAIAHEERHRALDINAIAPGAINSRMTTEVIALGAGIVGDEEYEQAVARRVNGGGSIEKVLDLVEWMISRNSDGISGRLIAAQWDDWSKISPT